MSQRQTFSQHQQGITDTSLKHHQCITDISDILSVFIHAYPGHISEMFILWWCVVIFICQWCLEHLCRIVGFIIVKTQKEMIQPHLERTLFKWCLADVWWLCCDFHSFNPFYRHVRFVFAVGISLNWGNRHLSNWGTHDGQRRTPTNRLSSPWRMGLSTWRGYNFFPLKKLL